MDNILDNTIGTLNTSSNIFLQLWEISHFLTILFALTSIVALSLPILAIIAKYNPGLLNNIWVKNKVCNNCLKIDFNTKLDNIAETQKKQSDDLMRLRKESLKTQILLTNTSYERKLYLFDEYVKLGGNGWMREWIDSYKKENKKS